MSDKITDDCISFGACEPEFKNEAISEGEEAYVIDLDRYTECVDSFEPLKCAKVCPVDACVLDPDHEESQEQLLEKWHKLHPGETAAYIP